MLLAEGEQGKKHQALITPRRTSVYSACRSSVILCRFFSRVWVSAYWQASERGACGSDGRTMMATPDQRASSRSIQPKLPVLVM